MDANDVEMDNNNQDVMHIVNKIQLINKWKTLLNIQLF